MNRQKITIIVAVLTLPVLMSNIAYRKTSGAHPASTSAPGEQTCTKSGCHTTASVNSGTGVNTLVFPSADSTYVCGATYPITLQVQKSGIEKFGFQLVVLKDSNNTSTGELIASDADRTHLQTATVSSKVRTYITHSTDGTPATSTDNNSWTFYWTAPAKNEGNITFYYVTNCTNNNGANTGDALYKSSFKIKPSGGTSINEFIAGNHFTANYVNIDNSINISYTLKIPSKITIRLYDIQGRKLQTEKYDHPSTGEYSDKFGLEKQLSAGVYMLNLTTNERSISRKIFIQ